MRVALAHHILAAGVFVHGIADGVTCRDAGRSQQRERQVREALQTALHLAPLHVDAHLALARFHAETIDQVGELIGGMVHGARKDQGLALYEAALALAPDSLIALSEAAEGLLMLGGEAEQARAAELLAQAQRVAPLDAMEKLYLHALQAAGER